MKTVQFVVHGRVQGVAYRASCRRAAQRIGVVGWVRNHPDQTVEGVVQGTPDGVVEFLQWCREGPPMAKVLRLDQKEIGPDDYSDFSVRR